MIGAGEAITLNDGRDYLCADTIQLDDKNYLYLITVSEPVEVCFAEQITTGDNPQIRVVTAREEKARIFTVLQDKIQASLADK